jgi:hypothetical protein
VLTEASKSATADLVLLVIGPQASDKGPMKFGVRQGRSQDQCLVLFGDVRLNVLGDGLLEEGFVWSFSIVVFVGVVVVVVVIVVVAIIISPISSF